MACQHLPGVMCENCYGRIQGVVAVTPLQAPEPIVLVSSIEFQALKQEVAEIRKALEGILPKRESGALSVSPKTVCPSCGSSNLKYSPYILTSDPPQQEFSCLDCQTLHRKTL